MTEGDVAFGLPGFKQFLCAPERLLELPGEKVIPAAPGNGFMGQVNQPLLWNSPSAFPGTL